MGSAHIATPWRNIDEGKLAETIPPQWPLTTHSRLSDLAHVS